MSIKEVVAILEGRLMSSQLEQFENLLTSSDWLEKSQPFNKATFCLTMQRD